MPESDAEREARLQAEIAAAVEQRRADLEARMERDRREAEAARQRAQSNGHA